jgi:gas vesicle protein
MKMLKFLFGFLAGVGIGWTIGTLMAPAEGSELQARLRQKFDAVVQEGRRAAEQRRAELEAQFMAAKAPAGEPTQTA